MSPPLSARSSGHARMHDSPANWRTFDVPVSWHIAHPDQTADQTRGFCTAKAGSGTASTMLKDGDVGADPEASVSATMAAKLGLRPIAVPHSRTS